MGIDWTDGKLVVPSYAEGLSMPTLSNRTVVIWSGGADSTLILDQLAREASSTHPILAISISGHPQMPDAQFPAEALAREAYLRHARSKGYHIQHETISLKNSEGLVVQGEATQAVVWFSAVMPYIGDKDRVYLGYIRGDDFWHWHEAYRRLFDTFCAFKGIQAALHFPLEWADKASVMRQLLLYGVPKSCYWTCENPQRSETSPGTFEPCTYCNKCCAMQDAESRQPLKLSGRARLVTPKTKRQVQALQKALALKPKPITATTRRGRKGSDHA